MRKQLRQQVDGHEHFIVGLILSTSEELLFKSNLARKKDTLPTIAVNKKELER